MGDHPGGLRAETGHGEAPRWGEAWGASADPERPRHSEAGVRTGDERNGRWRTGEPDSLHRPLHTEESRKHFRQQGPGTSVYGGREETVGSERMLDVFPFRRPQERRNERVSSITFIRHLIPHKA